MAEEEEEAEIMVKMNNNSSVLIKYFKLYRRNPTENNLVKFMGTAIIEYTRMVTGTYDYCVSCSELTRNSDSLFSWMKNDLYFREWFKKQFNYWIAVENDGLVLVDLRLNDLKKHGNKKLEPKRKFAKPRDVDDLVPEV